MDVRIANPHPAIAFAASELARYLAMLSGGAEVGGSIRLGLFGDCAVSDPPRASDSALDDALIVDIAGGNGIIAGGNPRSVLVAVYRMLWELGCRWVRPGRAGDMIPPRDLSGFSVQLRETASYRHRVVCIEGAVSLTNVLEMIDWLPKLGFGGFYMQFRDGYTFFDRWYSHEENARRRRKEPIERTAAIEYTALIEQEMARRGLLYHAVGHGWHTEAYGIPALGWMDMGELPAEFTGNVALVGGRRAVPWNMPMLTALCYSDPQVQQRLVGCVADYAQSHPQVHYLHVWLDDWVNNKCECDRCRTARPADWYIQILNAIDAELTRRDIATKIVFLAYCDLRWPPLKRWFDASDRFVFMYANGRKDYRQPLRPVSGAAAELPAFALNRLADANEIEPVAAFLQAWKSRFDGDSFIFEYYGGAETIDLAQVVWQDIRSLADFGLNGLVNCQPLRVFYPDGLGMTVMGRTLWNRQLSFEQIADDYFAASYGADGALCQRFTQAAQEAARMLRQGEDAEREAAGRRLHDHLAAFAPILERNRSIHAGDQCRRTSWRMMDLYVQALRLMLEHAAAGAQHLEQSRQFAHHALQQHLLAVEDELQPWLQPVRFARSLLG